MGQNVYSIEELLVRCQEARKSGRDFPTVWAEVLRTHPMVLGVPIQVMVGSSPCLKIPLIGDHYLCFYSDAVRLED